MFSNFSRTNECHVCAHSSPALQRGCLCCSNPDPHLKMHPYGIQAGTASYPKAFDPTWKLVKCANFAHAIGVAGRGSSASCSPLPPTLPFRNAASWRAIGYKVFFRYGKVYLFHPVHGTIHSTPVNGGQWMNHTNPASAPWLDVTLEVRGTSLEMEFRLSSYCCYCESLGEATCDFCAGRRPVVEPLPVRSSLSAAV